MDIAKLDLAGSWAYFDAVDFDKFGRLGFFLIPVSPEIEKATIRGFDTDDYNTILKSVSSLVVDWDLTKNGEKLECNDATKKEYLPYLLRIMVKVKKTKETDPEERGLGLAIYKFSDTMGNFVKN